MALSVALTQLIDLGALGITAYPFTLAGWFRVPNVNNLVTLMGIGNSTTGSYHRLIFLGQSTKSAGAVSSITSTATASSTTAMTPGQWHHVVGVFEAANLRRVYLDGGNVGTSSQNRVFDGANQYSLGSLSSDAVEVAEAAVFKVALTAGQIAMLAAGMSPLCLSVFAQLAAYQSCVRRLNWPGRGPVASAASAPGVAAHPRVFWRRNFGSQALPYRLRGPFHSEQTFFQTAGPQAGQQLMAGASGGQMAVAGVAAGAAMLSGEVQS
ncbi:MAG: LamG-like jellyroll fold domain-containing protein [Bythopirellula sp.]|nr:LamG-like jellyroll fold domain-containing protein [Bythopirellula sp.]